MIRVHDFLKALAVAVLVSACGGGGGDAGTSPFGNGDGGGSTGAADLSLTLSSTSLSNTGTSVVTVTATAVDASRVALAGVPVVIGVDNNAVVVVGSSTTDSSGSVTATVNLGTDRSNRVVTVTAKSGSLTRTAAFQVTGAKLTATLAPAVVAPGASAQVQYRLTDANDNPMAGQAISVSGGSLTGAEATTGSNGEYVFSYAAPATAGNLDITALAGGATSVQTVLVQSGANTIPNAIGPVLSASVTANPSVVAVNADTTSNRAEIRALFLGEQNRPVPRVRVRFDLNGDANSIGGAMSTALNTVYSDANGVAVSAYVPGTRSSPTDGLTVRACWDYTDFAAGTCPNQALVTLTVTSEALAVTIGTNNLIESGAGELTYIKKYVVLVVDASGQAKPDVQLSPSVDLVGYVKGSYPSGPKAWVQLPTAACLNEDINRNGVLEANENDGVETLNSSGAPVPDNANGTLEPRKSDVAITMVGGSRTNSSGIAILQIEYPKNVATWVDFVITIAASGIAGTEGRDTWVGRLPGAAEDFEAEVPPPFVRSPYGLSASCSNPN